MSRIIKLAGMSLCLVIIGLGLTACGGGKPSTASDSDTTQQNTAVVVALPTNAAGEEIVARINGQDITRAEYEREFSRRQATSNAADLDALAAATLDTMIEQAIIEQAAAAMGIAVTDAQIDAEIVTQQSLILPEEQLYDPALFTEAEYREAQWGALLTLAVRDAVVDVEGQSITWIHARHILVNTEEEANAVIARLQGGEDFADLAQQVSRDSTTKDAGGDLGWFTREDLITPELADTAMQMQPGQIAGPIPTMIGYHVMQLLAVEQREALNEQQAELAQSQFTTWLQQQRDSAIVERFLN